MKKSRHFQQPVQKEAKKSKAGLYLSIFIAGIMVLSVGAIFLENPNEANSFSYGKHSFKPVNGMWETKLSGEKTSFYFLPDQVSIYAPKKEILDALRNSQGVIIAFDPSINLTTQLQAIDVFKFELATALTKIYSSKQVLFATTYASPSYSFPVVSCVNASFVAPVVVAEYGDNSSISLSGSCIHVIAASEQTMLELTDALKYGLYGVFNEETN